MRNYPRLKDLPVGSKHPLTKHLVTPYSHQCSLVINPGERAEVLANIRAKHGNVFADILQNLPSHIDGIEKLMEASFLGKKRMTYSSLDRILIRWWGGKDLKSIEEFKASLERMQLPHPATNGKKSTPSSFFTGKAPEAGRPTVKLTPSLAQKLIDASPKVKAATAVIPMTVGDVQKVVTQPRKSLKAIFKNKADDTSSLSASLDELRIRRLGVVRELRQIDEAIASLQALINR